MINLKCTFAVTAGLCSSLAYAQNQPHIILIMTDQQRGDAMGCMGNESVISPHLDALASEGTLFMNGYSSCPSSTPARAGLLTGQSPWHHGLLGYGKVAPKYNHEMPQMLKDAGYYTFGIGKCTGIRNESNTVSKERCWMKADAGKIRISSVTIAYGFKYKHRERTRMKPESDGTITEQLPIN